MSPNLDRNGDVLEVRQDLIPEATYQTLLDQEVDDDPDQSQDPVQDEPVQALRSSDVRYWSDFNRVYYVPRTIQKLPDVAEWENTEGNWQLSKDTFERYDTVNGNHFLMYWTSLTMMFPIRRHL